MNRMTNQRVLRANTNQKVQTKNPIKGLQKVWKGSRDR